MVTGKLTIFPCCEFQTKLFMFSQTGLMKVQKVSLHLKEVRIRVQLIGTAQTFEIGLPIVGFIGFVDNVGVETSNLRAKFKYRMMGGWNEVVDKSDTPVG